MSEGPWDDAPAHYKSTDAEVLGAWDAAQQGFRDFRAAKDEWAKGYPQHEPFALQSSDRLWLVGLLWSSDVGSPGEGWRRAQRSDIWGWVPDKRTKIGKALAASIAAIKAEHVKDIAGMPGLAVVGNRFCHPGLFVYEGVAYVNWSISFAEVESSRWSKEGVDESKWTRIKRSEFYAAQEASKEADRAKGDAS
jgi:hypothetical protein